MRDILTQKDAVTPVNQGTQDETAETAEPPVSQRPPPSERLGWGPHDPLGALHTAPPVEPTPPTRRSIDV